MKIRPVEAELPSCSMRTDGRDEANSRFSQFLRTRLKNVQSYIWRMTKKYEMTTNEYVRKRHWQVIWILICSIQQYGWRYTSPWSWLQGIKRYSLKRQRPLLLLLHNLLIARMHPHNSLPSYCSLLIQINVLNHLAASFNVSKPVSQLRNYHGSLLWLMRRFVAFLKGTLISIVRSWM
jgi:hypothetical protein